MSGEPSPLATERREFLLAELHRTGAVRGSVVAKMLGVSELTIRRDIAELARTGRAVSVHGGATLPADAELPSGGHEGRTLGMVVPSLEYYWPDVIVGARSAAEDASARIVLRGSSYDGGVGDRHQLTALLRGGRVDGLLVAPAAGTRLGARILPWLEQLPVPVVLMERQVPIAAGSHRLGWVTTDHALGADLAVRHLARQGHRRVAVMVGRESPTSVHVVRGWRDACASLHLDVDGREDVIVADPPSPDGRRDVRGALARVLARGATAVLVHSDLDAIAVLEACRAIGVRVPRDLALVAYDDEVAASASPALTAVRPPREEIGRRSVEMLLERIEHGADRSVQRLQLVPTLIVRESSVRTE